MQYYKLIENSKIFDMTLVEYEKFINSEIQEEVLEKIYLTPKYIKKDGKMTILYKRIETFFDRGENRNENIKKAFKYGYTKTEIAEYLGISHTTISRVLQRN